MNARVLVIEDNAENMELLVYLLRSLGVEVLTAVDGTTGLEIAEREVPDAILCDIRMPVMDGFEVARRVKAQPALTAIPLIAISASVSGADRARSLAAGFQEFIAKPLEPEQFLARMMEVLGQPRPAAPDSGNQETP